LLNFEHSTFGAEYEFGDVWLTDLPDGLTWNRKDYSVVSSTGIANDPKGLIYKRGGEINSRPSESLEEQILMFEKLLVMHPEASVNHRTNLHLHVRVPGLSEDLASLKRLLKYIDTHQSEIYEVIEPIPVPSLGDFSPEELRGARKRFNRRKVSHQYKVPKNRVQAALKAETVQEFLAAHAPTSQSGEPAWGLTTRAGINLLQIKETDTIEFRHFTCTRSPRKLLSCFIWVKNFIPMALENAPVSELLSSSDCDFPPFAPYNDSMEKGYSYTNFDKNSRKVVEERICKLRELVDIDTCSSEETVAAIREIESSRTAQFL